jgi:predicted site-specific integrase-resolvase
MTKSIDFRGGTEGARDIESCAFQPRLMNLHDAAAYIGVSYWTLRDYVFDGIIARVTLPCARRRKKGGAIVRRAGDMDARRIYVDRADLDALIERCKEHADGFDID